MLIVKVDDKKGGIEKALKTLKSKVKQTKQNERLRDRKEYVKPSEERRKQKLLSEFNSRKKQENLN